MSESVITFTDLGHSYRRGTWVFRNYSGSITKSHVFALLGPNGRGKTTFLKLLLGALKPTEGSVSLKGHFAFVPQLFQVSFDYSCLDMVLMGRAKKIGLFAQPTRKDEEAALEALDRLGIADYANRPFHELSGGQRQLVIFARTLLAEAEILILDEPTSALDLKNQTLILDWIDNLSRKDGLTIVMTTHHPHHALAIADEALLMMEQGIPIFGSPSEILNEANLTSLYGVPMKRVVFEHGGRQIETLAQVLPTTSAVAASPNPIAINA
jgi:iron complex transport system ATP-binding protein